MTILRTDHRSPDLDPPDGWAGRGAWLLLAGSVALYLAYVLVWDRSGFHDASVYRAEALALRDGLDLYGPLPGIHGLATYPPFAAAAFSPMLLVPDAVAGVLSVPVNVALLVAAAYLSLRRVGGRVDLRVAVPLLAAVALWCEPVLSNNGFGQINLLILCLVLGDFSLPPDSRWRGVGIGLAAALKVTPGIFVVYLVVTGRFRAAAAACGTLLATIVVSAVVAPSATWSYWTQHVFDTDRVGRLENSLNQTLRGWLVRATHSVDTTAVTTVVTAAALVVGLAAAAYCHRRAGDRWGLLVVALTGLVVSPISWSHHWVWCVPLLALAWYEARVLVVPTLIVFWAQLVRLVPHGDHVELDLGPAWVALSGWYVAYAVVFTMVAVHATGSRPPPTPALGAGATAAGAPRALRRRRPA